MNFLKKILAATITLLTSISFTFPTFAAPKNLKSTTMKSLPVEVMDTGGTLIFSDSPEYVRQNGILYTDVVSGDARILFYHLNDTGVKKKLAVIVENVYPAENKIEITRGGFALPDNNFLSVGKATQLIYMQDNFHDTIKLAEGERKLFQAEMDKVTINAGHLIYGVYDFKSTGAVKIYVLMYPHNANPLKFLDAATILPKDEHKLRGTFKRMNRTIRLKRTYNPKVDGIACLKIGDDVKDIFKRGIDATDGEEVVNYGNYGINYTLEFRTNGTTRFCLSPLGGYYAGVMRFNHAGKTGTILTPTGRIYFGSRKFNMPLSLQKSRKNGEEILTAQMELSELGSYNGLVRFEYSPPGASNLPVCIILFPPDLNF